MHRCHPQKDGRHHELVDRYDVSAPWEPICSTCHSFSYSFVFPGLDFLWVRFPYWCTWSCSKVLVESELLIYFRCFVCTILVISCPLYCVPVFHVLSLFLDYILLISVRILFPLFALTVLKNNYNLQHLQYWKMLEIQSTVKMQKRQVMK